MRFLFLATAAAFALASCSSGGSSSSPIARVTPVPTAPAGTASAPPVATPNASARFTITVPNGTSASKALRHRAYISTATQSIIITLVSVNGVAYTGTPTEIASNLTTSNPECTGSPLTCTVLAPAVGGSDVFNVSTYDAQQTSSDPSSPAGNKLSQATVTISVIAGEANTDNTALVLSGVVSSVDLGLSPTSVTEGSSANVTVSVNVRDADDKIIMGSYVDAAGDALTIDLGDTDSTGATSVSPASVTTSSTEVSIAYNGGSISSPTITPTVYGGTISGALTGVTLQVITPGPIVLSASSLSFNGTSQTQTVGITDSGYTGSYTVSGCSSPSVATASITGSTLSVTSAAAGSCSLTVSDSFNNTQTESVVVTTLTIPVQ